MGNKTYRVSFLPDTSLDEKYNALKILEGRGVPCSLRFDRSKTQIEIIHMTDNFSPEETAAALPNYCVLTETTGQSLI